MVTMKTRTVCDDIRDKAELDPARIALLSAKGFCTYRELADRMNLVASRLQREGLCPGDRVLIVLHSEIDCLVAIASAMAAGGIAVPTPADAAGGSLHFMLEDCDPRILITSSADRERYSSILTSGKLKPIGTDCPGVDCYRVVGSPENLNRRSVPTGGKHLPENAALILYTSGVCKYPRGVLLSHDNLHAAVTNTLASICLDEGVREAVAVSAIQAFGFGRICCILRVGGTAVLAEAAANPTRMLEMILRHTCHAISLSPPMLPRLLGSRNVMLEQLAPLIRLINLAGPHVPVEHRIRTLRLFPRARIIIQYTFTEAPNVASIECHGESSHIDTAGRPSPNTSLVILGRDGTKNAQGQIGEVAVRGDQVAVGYWGDEALTSKRFLQGGWFKTGDQGYVDAEGYLHLLGRCDDIIVVGGELIVPEEIEDCVRDLYPDLEPCVVGVPDPAGVFGQIPALCYRSLSGAEPSPLEVVEAMADRLDGGKAPRFVCSLDDFPRFQNGNIDRREVERIVRKMTKHRTLQAIMMLDGGCVPRTTAQIITKEEHHSGHNAFEMVGIDNEK